MSWANEMRDLRSTLDDYAYRISRWRWLFRLVILSLSFLAIWATATHAQARRVCVDWGTCASRSQEWPHNVYRYRCCKHRAWVDSYQRRYDDDNGNGRHSHSYSHTREHCAKDDHGRPAVIEVVGLSALDEKAAENNAQRQWRVTVTHRFGEVYSDLANASRYSWRCVPVSTNETVLGKAGEFIAGEAAVRKRCGLQAVPCKQPMIAGEPPERGDRSSDRRER